jgi:diaminopimelate epimerase
MKFYKYHGAGNDFILIDNRQDEIEEASKPKLAVKLCHRRFGIGGDGLMLLENSEKHDAKMRIFNPDGSEAEMCGNGIRCFAKHVYDHGIMRKEELDIDTLGGVKKASLTIEKGRVAYVKVDMGKPRIDNLNLVIPVKGKEREMTALKVGVPPAVLLVDDLSGVEVLELGRAIRSNQVFPRGTNVNFLQRVGKNRFKIRTYERGVEDETLACGTGICASGAAAVLLGMADADKPIEIEARGGKIFIETVKVGEELERAYMSGPAEFVFAGEIEP